MLSVLDERVLGSVQGGLGFSLLEGAGSELSLGGFQGGGGVGNFGLSEAKFTNALGLLSLVDVVVGHLLLVDGSFESIQNTLDCVEGATNLESVFNFEHDRHDVSSV